MGCFDIWSVYAAGKQKHTIEEHVPPMIPNTTLMLGQKMAMMRDKYTKTVVMRTCRVVLAFDLEKNIISRVNRIGNTLSGNATATVNVIAARDTAMIVSLRSKLIKMFPFAFGSNNVLPNAK